MLKIENVKIEGYWYSKYENQYPMPVSNVLSQEEAEQIYALILEKEKTARKVLYKGFSSSRITGERLGCEEYFSEDILWRWPGDFAEHYVLKHKVKPTDEFLIYIGYNKK